MLINYNVIYYPVQVALCQFGVALYYYKNSGFNLVRPGLNQRFVYFSDVLL